MTDTRPVRVTQTRWEAEGILSLRLASVDRTPLPGWSPGAHIDLVRIDRAEGPLPLPEIVAGVPDSAALYACGPTGMLEALTDVVARQRPDLALHSERFTAPPAPGRTTEAPGGRTFEVELARTGERVTIEPGRSILDAVRAVRPDVLSSCEEGFRGTCETKVLEGRPIHRDTILTARERAKNTSMMICVGACASRRLVLDL